MGIVDKAIEALQRKKLEAEQTRLVRDSYEARERDTAARAVTEREAQRQQAEKSRPLAEVREKEPGPATRLFVDEATKARVVEAAKQPPQPGRAEQPDRDRVASEKEAKHQPPRSSPVPTLGAGAVSRTEIRETMAQRIAREQAEKAPSQERSPAPAIERPSFPKPEIARMDERVMSKEQIALRKNNDDLKAHRIDRITALDRELRILTGNDKEGQKTRTMQPDRAGGRNLSSDR